MSSLTIAQQCAPTLAGLKAGSLFSVHDEKNTVERAVKELDAALSKKGVRAVLLHRNCRDVNLVYLYRERDLDAILSDREIQSFLSEYGYTNFSIQPCLDKLSERLNHESFPHDVGVFLDYPLADIREFIANRGMNCPCTGCWKAYTNIHEAQRKFRKFKRCTALYCRWADAGRDLAQLTRAC